MGDPKSPEMSVVIVTPDYETIRKTMGYLRKQTIRDRLEIVIVTPSRDEFGLNESEIKYFFRVRIVEAGPIHSTAKARVTGIRQASAPVIAFVEDHSYPGLGWAEALIKAHRQPWAVVGPVMCNANPNRLTSWADFLISYGRWLDPTPAGLINHLPGHNSSYKRKILLDYGSTLEDMLEAESVLHWDLRAKGYRLYLEPAAKTSHLNFERLSSWISAQFHSGRLFAITRAKGWSLMRRLLYLGGAPLIPVVRLWRTLQQLRRSDQQRNLLPQILPTLILGLVASAAGEMIGHLLGPGNVQERMCDLEFHRSRYLID